MDRGLLLNLWDFMGFPLRAFILSERVQKSLGLTTLKEERLSIVFRFLKGRVLDIGCGHNELVQRYRTAHGTGIGVDICPFPGADRVVDTTRLPYRNGEFDTVTIVAALNHIPAAQRRQVLMEARRVLKDDGILIITMLNYGIGWLCHKLMWWDSDQRERDVDFTQESYGLPNLYVISLARACGFRFRERRTFVYGLNNLFLFEKRALRSGDAA